MSHKLDEKDIQILRLLQKNSKITIREISKLVKAAPTTVFAKIKRMEKNGIVKEYKAILDSTKLGKGTTVFVLASITYRMEGQKLSQREIAKKIAKFPEVQEVHIIAGDWDLLIKVKAESAEAIGNFVIDKLRLVDGIEKTLTCVVFTTEKETTEISL